MPQYLDASAVRVVTGGAADTTALLEMRWDHILYTGNGSVGRLVMAAAARHLTPVTLELGGKSPVIVAKSANISLAAKRIALGKWFANAGQVCISPDYVLCDEAVEAPLLAALANELKATVGEGRVAHGVDCSAEDEGLCAFGRIINGRHVERISALLDGCGGKTVVGDASQIDAAARYVPPMLISRPDHASELLKQEIFADPPRRRCRRSTSRSRASVKSARPAGAVRVHRGWGGGGARAGGDPVGRRVGEHDHGARARGGRALRRRRRLGDGELPRQVWVRRILAQAIGALPDDEGPHHLRARRFGQGRPRASGSHLALKNRVTGFIPPTVVAKLKAAAAVAAAAVSPRLPPPISLKRDVYRLHMAGLIKFIITARTHRPEGRSSSTVRRSRLCPALSPRPRRPFQNQPKISPTPARRRRP